MQNMMGYNEKNFNASTACLLPLILGVGKISQNGKSDSPFESQ